ncbi:MAG: PrsW family intramembrane metalloprotease [Dermatophilaceae bacterium]
MASGGGWPREPSARRHPAYLAEGSPSAPGSTPRQGRRFTPASVLAVVGFVVCWVLLAVFLGAELGPRTAALAAVLAALPLLVVVPAFLWLDRLEAEPARYLFFAFLWGSLCAPVGALLLNTGAHLFFQVAGAQDPLTLSAVWTAPPAEEGLKALGVLLLLLLRREEFDGVIDGLVYAGLVGAGFAFSENILYLGRAYLDYGIAGLNAVFVLRCVMAPFAHPLFTACTGIGLGLAVSVARTPAGRVCFAVGGYCCAVLLHATWNLSASVGQYQTMYLAFQVPVFFGFVALVLVMRRREAALVRRYLGQYAAAGWLTLPEVGMLASVPQRRTARRWARANGGPVGLASMRAFQGAAGDLALLRARIVRGAAEAGAPQRELALLEAMTAYRRGFVESAAA